MGWVEGSASRRQVLCSAPSAREGHLTPLIVDSGALHLYRYQNRAVALRAACMRSRSLSSLEPHPSQSLLRSAYLDLVDHR